MSARVMKTLSQFTPEMEIYSIDEAFLDLFGLDHLNLAEYESLIRHTVKQWTGLPVCAGIGKTKTLAKAANHIVKRFTDNGVFLLDDHNQDEILSKFLLVSHYYLPFCLNPPHVL